MFEPQGFSELHYNLPADGERVCALQSLIGSFWSRALFLIPPRTWYKTYSPSCRERPNRNQRTNTPAGFACFIIAVGWEKSRKKGFSFSSWYFFFFFWAPDISTGVWRRCWQDLGLRQDVLILFQPDFSPLWAVMDATASTEWFTSEVLCGSKTLTF